MKFYNYAVIHQEHLLTTRQQQNSLMPSTGFQEVQ